MDLSKTEEVIAKLESLHWQLPVWDFLLLLPRLYANNVHVEDGRPPRGRTRTPLGSEWERPTPPPGQGERGPCSKGNCTLASAAATAQEAHGARACVHRPPTLELPAPGARAHRGQLSPLECAPKARGVQWQLLAGVWMVLACAGRVSTRVHEAFEVQTELAGRLGRGGLWDQDSHPRHSGA
ncbi:hypothetical protein J1605_013464 [Eschrichtius robustus]|uniref:Uncharacterized protein n=1 Tax=Eschrichtius robustus TaxID=9764 RepID=A0AB34GF10_ESCRO|nr:hypothetical protein J1605_013464 [Eschrichtius robustus]